MRLGSSRGPFFYSLYCQSPLILCSPSSQEGQTAVSANDRWEKRMDYSDLCGNLGAVGRTRRGHALCLFRTAGWKHL